MPSPDSGLTQFLAVWGAILSSITFGWSLYRDLRDRAKIKVSAELRRIGQRDGDGARGAKRKHARYVVTFNPVGVHDRHQQHKDDREQEPARTDGQPLG